jgi:hypothetical protein
VRDSTGGGGRAVIGRMAGGLLEWSAAHRRRQLERASREAAAIQEATLVRLVAAARDTEFGLAHGFGDIRSVSDYQGRVPVREHPYFRPLWERAVWGEENVTWPGRCRDWVKTAGTTAGGKMIPVTREAFRSHRRGGWDALLMAIERVGARQLMGGPLLLLGGTTAPHPVGAGGRIGDLSGFAVRHLPPGLRQLYSPGSRVAAISGWEERIEAVATLASHQDLRLLVGMPSWLVVFFEHVARQRRAVGRPLRHLGECWPNLRVLIHGGVAFAPYASVFDEWMGHPLERVEVYPASEGFVAVQTEPSGGLTLMPDYGIFYEFVPVEDLGTDRPRRHTVADVELNRQYAVVLTTPAGLWAYVLGDTVRFTARDPLRLQVTGRTRHHLNAFGENVIVEEVERALTGACRRTEAEAVEFTVAPLHPSAEEPRGGHEWLVEFRIPPQEPEDFARVLDERLMALNADYRTRRAGSVGMVAPRVTPLPAGTFHRWMRVAGKLGDQHKVPRVTNGRSLAEALLASAGPVRPPWPASSRAASAPCSPWPVARL